MKRHGALSLLNPQSSHIYSLKKVIGRLLCKNSNVFHTKIIIQDLSCSLSNKKNIGADNKPVEDPPSSRPPGGLLSLLQGADKLPTFETKPKGEFSMDFPYQGHATKSIDKLSNTSSTKPVTAAPPVLTCEDLEQSILSEVSEIYPPPPPPPLPVDQDFSVSSVKKTKQRKASVDDQASQHLLSLLQRSADPKSQDTVIETRLPPSVKASTAGEVLAPEKSLTLENLFGSAFMNELQSIGEPASGRATVTDAPVVTLRSDRSMGELSQRNQIRPDGLPGGLQGLPGDGNFLGVGDPVKYMSSPGSHNQELEVTFDISDKLAALNSGPRNERPTMGVQDGPFLQHHPQQYAHVKPQLDFMGQGSIRGQHQDSSPNHRFPPNIIHHRPPFQNSTTSGLPEFDRLPPHMVHMQDNLQRQHLMQGFPGGAPPHHHSPNVNNQMQGLIPELNPSQGIPFAHRQPNYGMPPGITKGDQTISYYIYPLKNSNFRSFFLPWIQNLLWTGVCSSLELVSQNIYFVFVSFQVLKSTELIIQLHFRHSWGFTRG